MTSTWRLGVLAVVFAVFLGVLVLRLWTIQVTAASAYEEQAQTNQVRLVRTPAPRGDIFDRNGELLAGTRPSLAAVVDMALVDEAVVDFLVQQLAAFLDVPASAVQETIDNAPEGDQIILADDLGAEQAAFLVEHREDFPGVAIIPQPVRTYPEGRIGAHVLGYIGRPQQEDIDGGVASTDVVGRAGVERSYDDVLRGEQGIIKYRVDARRSVFATAGEQDPAPGGSLMLTIDAAVQRQLQQSLEEAVRFARAEEMEQRAAAKVTLPAGAEFLAARYLADEAEVDPNEFLGPLYDGLPIDENRVCKPVERHQLDLGESVLLSGEERRVMTLERIRGSDDAPRATVMVDGVSFDVKPRDAFATTLRVETIDVAGDTVALTHHDKWCPVRAVGVVLDPDDGSVLAMGSWPDFSPADFVGGIADSTWNELLTTSGFTNFAIQGVYAPGSTFKSLAYMAAMEEGAFPLNDAPLIENALDGEPANETEPLQSHTDTYFCNGVKRFNLTDGSQQTYQDWNFPRGHGELDLHGAFEQSCDLYFWEIALRVWKSGEEFDEDLLQQWARRFGFDNQSGIDLPFERDGLIPDREWFNAMQREFPGRVRAEGPWVGGDLMNVVVGQGDVLVTPLQLANAYAAMVNGGTVWQPRVVSAVLDASGDVVQSHPAEVLERIELSPITTGFFRRDLHRVVSAGTGAQAFLNFGAGADGIGGKTGTAEVIKRTEEQRDLARDQGFLPRIFDADSAWFVGVAPVNDPEFVTAVVVERGGSGGGVAAPFARQVMQFVLNGADAVTPVTRIEEHLD